MLARRLLTALSLVLLAACSSGDTKTATSRVGGQQHGISAPGEKALRLTEKWTWRSPAGASAGMPAADGSLVALTSGRQRLSVLDAQGARQWEASRVGLRDVAPTLTANLVLAATDDGVAAYDRSSGRERWVASLGERANTPVVAAGRAVVTTWEGSLAALDLADGKVAWRFALGGDALGPAAATAAGDTVVATFDSGRAAGAVTVDAASGRQRWKVPLPADGVSGPAIVEAARTVVVVAADVAAHGLSLDDGSTRWRRPLEGAGSPEVPPLALAEGDVLVAHRQGGFALLDGRDGTRRWEASSGGATVRGRPAGPGPNGWFALPLHDGRLLLAGPDRPIDLREPPALVTGVASGPRDLLLVATGQGRENALTALGGW